MKKHSWMVDINDYFPLIGNEALERIRHELDLYSAFEPSFRLDHRRASVLAAADPREVPDGR